MTTIAYTTMKSPVGNLLIAATRDGVCAVEFERDDDHDVIGRRFGNAGMKRAADPGGAVTALRAYFKGDLRAVDGIRVDSGGTSFQQGVWRRIRKIPAGRTATYAELARSAGSPRAMRAAGTACGSNPVAIIVPCHRVVPSSGGLGNYGGGIEIKRWLLDHEGAG